MGQKNQAAAYNGARTVCCKTWFVFKGLEGIDSSTEEEYE